MSFNRTWRTILLDVVAVLRSFVNASEASLLALSLSRRKSSQIIWIDADRLMLRLVCIY